jgi:2,3-bisphosphoglycerate-independent phosphoglycerate mutase
MNLGAGRIVYQDLAKINLAVAHTLAKEQVLVDALRMPTNKSYLVSDMVHPIPPICGLIDATQQ